MDDDIRISGTSNRPEPTGEPSPVVSIILCTRQNAASLRLTLDAMAGCVVPPELSAELLVVDNGSTDDTPAVVAATHIPGIEVRRLFEPRPGKGFAYEVGLARARGQILLFIDDDTWPGRHWIAGMCRPILDDQTDAVAGGVVLAPDLMRPWMTPEHRTWLASTELLPTEPNWRMIGANMAFSRRVLGVVPAFDVELGAGALGYGDETLFSHQIVRAGFRVRRALEVTVEHHFRPDRLSPAAFREMARKMGRSEAYIERHWLHYDRPLPRLRQFKHWLSLKAKTVFAGDKVPTIAELELIRTTALYGQAAREKKRPRTYDREGLRKLTNP